MKSLSWLNLAALCLSFVPGSVEAQPVPSMGAGETESHVTLVASTDGSCTLTNQTVQPRKTMERQVRSWERYTKMAEGIDSEDEDASPPLPEKAEQKALTNEELAAKLREMYLQRPDFAQDDSVRIENIEISTNSVRLVTSRSFASLKDLLSQSLHTWGPNPLMLEDARVEIDTNRNLRITFSGTEGASRRAKDVSRTWKSSKIKFEWKLVLPGRVLTSGLPATQENATWISLDGEKTETVDAALKLLGAPLVITAEPGGLKLDEPLESKKLARAAWRQRKLEPDLPITDAGPGFLAEPVGISLSTVHYFPEGTKHFKDRPEASGLGMKPAGTAVTVKLFPPKGRQIRSVSGLRVKAAIDDQGRPIAGVAKDDNDEASYSEFVSYSSGDSDKSGPARVEIRLALPAPDAKAIDEVEAEAVVLTLEGWKEMVLTNVQADAKREIDLSEVLPGAALIIKKIGGRKPQQTVEACLEGPRAVSQLEVKVKSSSRQGGRSTMSDRRSTTAGNKTTRNVTIQAYEFERGEDAKNAPLSLVVRYPQDLKRERVRFKLTALDLL